MQSKIFFFFLMRKVFTTWSQIFLFDIWHLFVNSFKKISLSDNQLAETYYRGLLSSLPIPLLLASASEVHISTLHDVFAQVYILQSFCCMLSSWLYPLLVKITHSKLVKVVNVYLPRHLIAKKRWRGHLEEHASAIILEFFGSQQYHGIHYVFQVTCSNFSTLTDLLSFYFLYERMPTESLAAMWSQ